MKTKEMVNMPIKQINLDSKILKTISYYSAFFIIGMCMAILGPTIPDLAENTHTQISQLSFLFTVRSLGYLIGAYLGGRIYDEIKGHPVIVIMLIATAVFMFLIPMLKLTGVLIVVLLFLGMSVSFIDVGGNTLLVWIHQEKIGTFMNGLHFFFGLGAFIAPVILARVIIVSGDFSWTYRFLALMIVPVIFLFLFIPSPPVRKTDLSITNGTFNGLLVAGIVFFFFLWAGTELGFGGWIYTYALSSGLIDKAGAAYLTSAFWGAFTLARLLSIPLAIRLKPVTLLLGSIVGVMVNLIVIISHPTSFNMLLVGTIGMGACMASVFPNMLAFSGRRIILNGRITSWFFIGSAIGGMTLPLVIGQFIESNPQLLLFILMGTVVCAFLVLFWICCWLRPKILSNN